jgi:hypothetical protein
VEQTNVQKNFITKLSSTRNLIYSRLPQLKEQNLCKIMSKIAHYHYDKKKFMLLGVERELYNILIENSLNPYTIYRWLLLERVPDDIRFQLKQQKISQKKALNKAFKRRREGFKELTQSIREYGLSLIMRM